MSIGTVASGATIAKAAYDIVKDVAGYLKNKPDPILEEKVLLLREKMFELMESDAALRTRVQELEEKLATQQAVFFDKDKRAYFTGTPENPEEGPYCATCYHEGKGLVPLGSARKRLGGVVNKSGAHFNYADLWVCPSCKSQIPRS